MSSPWNHHSMIRDCTRYRTAMSPATHSIFLVRHSSSDSREASTRNARAAWPQSVIIWRVGCSSRTLTAHSLNPFTHRSPSLASLNASNSTAGSPANSWAPAISCAARCATMSRFRQPWATLGWSHAGGSVNCIVRPRRCRSAYAIPASCVRSNATDSSSPRRDVTTAPTVRRRPTRPYRTRPHRADIVARVSKAIERFLGAAEVLGHPVQVRRFPEGTKTAEDAARAIGCEVGQIVKSLVFVAGDEPVLALTSGANRVDLVRLAALAGESEARRATPEEARAATGFAVGGTPPFGHPERIRTFLDRDLLAFEEIWAAAGTPDAVFRTTPEELRRTSEAEVADLKETPAGG